MRPEPKDPVIDAYIVIGSALIFILIHIIDTCESEPHNKHIKKETEKVLARAHEEAICLPDTLDLRVFTVNTESARQDSARLAKEMHKWMKHQGENPRFCNYTEVYDTINISNGQKGFRLSKYPWRIDIPKAKQDLLFATNYNAYKKAIQQLEVARRQQKQK